MRASDFDDWWYLANGTQGKFNSGDLISAQALNDLMAAIRALPLKS